MFGRFVRVSRCLLVMLCVMGVVPARAAVECAGTVTNLSVQLNAEGTLTVGLSSGPNYTYLCDVNAVRNGVSAVVCRTMYATLMAAKLVGKRVMIRFYDYNSCTSVPNWGDAGALGWTQLLLD